MLESYRHTPPVTRALLTLIALVYVGQVASQSLVGVDVFELVGVRFNPYVATGQWWRLLTPVFLHGSILHLGMNALALYRLGPQLEATYGRTRYLALFLVSGLAGSLAGFAFSPYASLGASGAIFGLLGAAAVFFYQHRALFGPAGKAIQQNLVVVAMLNLIISLTPGIDGWGHVGGLIGGVLMALAIGPRLVLVRRSPFDAGWPGRTAASTMVILDDDGSADETGRGGVSMAPFGLVDTRPPSTRTWWIVAGAFALILGATWLMTLTGAWARPLSP